MVLARPMLLERAFEKPEEIRELLLRSGPYASIGSYLPPAATGVRVVDGGPVDVLPWFRSNWAVNGVCRVAGAEAILHNPRFVGAAEHFLQAVSVMPSTVVVNVNAPMRAGAIHVDIPSFRGATRDRYALPLLQAMGASGLFERWRVVEVGIVTWFYAGPGGAYDYWPDGLDAPMASINGPFDNIALAADNDRMYHRIGWIGAPDAPSPPITPTATITHAGERWMIEDRAQVVATVPDPAVRMSILWKARADPMPADPPELTPSEIVDVFRLDFEARGQALPGGAGVLDDEAWLHRVHHTYYVDPEGGAGGAGAGPMHGA